MITISRPFDFDPSDLRDRTRLCHVTSSHILRKQLTQRIARRRNRNSSLLKAYRKARDENYALRQKIRMLEARLDNQP